MVFIIKSIFIILNQNDVKNFLLKYNYDVRKTHDARWIDQKCTYDVISAVSDCIDEYVKNTDTEFTVKDIWLSKYSKEYVMSLFTKPDPTLKASNEYDKYFGQPIKLLSYSKILSYRKSGNTYIYKVNDLKLLRYIASRHTNALNFLTQYIEKVLSDSDIIDVFMNFYERQNTSSYKEVKDYFCNFTKKHTKIEKDTECARIFTKIINPLAFKMKKKGTEKGRISKNIITLQSISYNRENWRDELSGKSKTETREDFKKSKKYKVNFQKKYEINKAKKFLKFFNEEQYNNVSEVYQKTETVIATQAHHIFPIKEYPEIATYLENIIMLTPNQHFSMAHPNNKTQYINKDFQYICLIAKMVKIIDNLNQDEIDKIYSFQDYKYVLNTGIKTNEFDNIEENDFLSILIKIDLFYSNFSQYEHLKNLNYPKIQ